jgi:hypothetical protein
LQFRHKSGFPLCVLYGLERDAVNAGASLVGPNQAIGVTEDVGPIHLVIERVEAIGRFLLGLAVQLPLQCPDAFRGC